MEIAVRQVLNLEAAIIVTTSSLLNAMALVATVHISIYRGF